MLSIRLWRPNVRSGLKPRPWQGRQTQTRFSWLWLFSICFDFWNSLVPDLLKLAAPYAYCRVYRLFDLARLA